MIVTKSVHETVDVDLDTDVEVNVLDVLEQASDDELQATGVVVKSDWQLLRRIAATGDLHKFLDHVVAMAWSSGVYVSTERMLNTSEREVA